MPTTLSGLLLFVVLLLPGFAYQVGKERRGTERTTSALRETAAVVAASVASEVVVFAVTSWLWSRHIDFGRLVRDPHKYWLCDPATLGWWAIGLLAGACVLAYLMTQLRGRKVPPLGIGWPRRSRSVGLSSQSCAGCGGSSPTYTRRRCQRGARCSGKPSSQKSSWTSRSQTGPTSAACS